MRKERLYWNCWLRRDLFHGFARDVRKLLCISCTGFVYEELVAGMHVFFPEV